jgi:hypothetical protein
MRRESAESGVKRTIPGRRGDDLAGSGNPGRAGIGRDVPGAGRTGMAGRAGPGRRRARQPRSADVGRRSIHDRPEAVQERECTGHREGDPLIRRRTRLVPVLKERQTRFVLAACLAGKSAAEIVAVLTAVFRRLDRRLRCSITLDDVPRPAPAAADRVCAPAPSSRRLLNRAFTSPG